MKKKCRKCGKIRECRTNNKAHVIGNTENLCNKCNKSIGEDWYEKNREYKMEYARQQRLENIDWLKWVKKNFKKLLPEQKLKALFSKSYLDE